MASTWCGVVVTGLGLVWSSTAMATTGLAWQWPEEGWRYALVARVDLSEFMRVQSQTNEEARAVDFDVRLVTTCRAVGPAGKSAWDVECVLDDVAVSATPTRGDVGRLQGVLTEWDQLLTGAHIEMVLSADGRLRNFDLEGVPKDNRRLVDIHENMRILLARVFAGFDLQLPKKGDDKARGQWREKTPETMKPPSKQGAMGSADVTHQIRTVEGSLVEIAAQGRGLIGTGEMIAVNGLEQPKNMYEVSLAGVARFDNERGVLVSRQYQSQGVPTASSDASEGAGIPFVQAVRVLLIGPDEAYDVGPSRELSVD